MTLAELKRDAAAGKIAFELTERFGKTGEDIPEGLRGIRTVQKVNSVAIFLLNKKGKSSELRFDSAKLVEYDGKSLTIYEAGERPLTEQEKNILAEWQKIQDDYCKKYPYSNCYWEKKGYFKNCPCPWLAGYETIRGKKYLYNGLVRDNRVRGDAILKYKIYALQ